MRKQPVAGFDHLFGREGETRLVRRPGIAQADADAVRLILEHRRGRNRLWLVPPLMILWANLHLLFWLSLLPFATGWMGENHFAELPTAVYGAVLLLAAIAYTVLQTTIIAAEGKGSRLAVAVGRDRKGKVSMALCAAAIPLAFFREWLADALYVSVALIWLVPDRRIEARLRGE